MITRDPAAIRTELSPDANTIVRPPTNAAQQASAAIDSLQLGQVRCDFMRMETFQEICQKWLTQPDQASLHHVVTLNPEMVMAAEHDTTFRQSVGQADLRVPDGAGLVWAQWYIRSQFWSLIPSLLAFSFRTVERITGVETVWLLARLCARAHLRLYLLGGTATQVKKTALVLQQQLPTLQVAASPDHAFAADGPPAIMHDIHEYAPAVVLVAYGAQKQIPWIEKHRGNLPPSVRIAVGVGGAFAILGEATPRAPRWLRQLNLEWLWRLLLEPTRLPRIWRATVQFPLLIAKQKAAQPPIFSTTPPR